MTSRSTKARTISGIQPTGDITLGNYVGAISEWKKLQDTTAALFFLADLHALTVERPPGEVYQTAVNHASWLLACGIDPEKATLFVQSDVREHSELAWHMQCVASFGELSRMTQFKDKSESNKFISAGLFTYPALQAADILLYDTNVVPVGDDQKQHLEFTRDVAIRFNSRFGETLVVPEHHIPEVGARVMDLQHPTKKMSKSADSPQGTIFLHDPIKTIEKKIKRAVTDTESDVRFDRENKPGVSNLLTLLSVATGEDIDALANKYTQYGPLKADVAAAWIEIIEPIQKRYAETSTAEVQTTLEKGATKARAIASDVMDRVRSAVNGSR